MERNRYMKTHKELYEMSVTVLRGPEKNSMGVTFELEEHGGRGRI